MSRSTGNGLKYGFDVAQPNATCFSQSFRRA